jgi:hypothetical protein
MLFSEGEMNKCVHIFFFLGGGIVTEESYKYLGYALNLFSNIIRCTGVQSYLG